MWMLIIMTCVQLECTEPKIAASFETEIACREAMESVKIEQGATICMRVNDDG